jgi:hypothetical protein
MASVLFPHGGREERECAGAVAGVVIFDLEAIGHFILE